MINNGLAEVRTTRFPNACLDLCRYINPLCYDVFDDSADDVMEMRAPKFRRCTYFALNLFMP